MNVKWVYWKRATILSGILVLLALAWWPQSESPTPGPTGIIAPASPDQLPAAVIRPRPVRRPVPHVEWETPQSFLASEEWKRSRPEAEYVYVLDTSDCYGLLLQAAMDAVPNPDTSHLGGCAGATPLHKANTPGQVQALLDAGADVNAQDKYGNSVLHSHAVRHSGTEDSLAIMDLLLENGADPRLENEHGEAPWKLAFLHSNVAPGHLVAHEGIVREAADQGLTIEDYLAVNPHKQARLDELMQGYLVEALIQRRLLAAAVASAPVVASR